MKNKYNPEEFLTENIKDFSLYLDDCLNVLPQMPSNCVDYTLTSPPYNRKRNDKYRNFVDVNENWYEMNVSVIKELLRVTKKHVFYNIQTNYYNRQDVYKLIGEFHKEIKEIFVWGKTNPMPASGYSITNSVEYFLVLGNSALKSNKTYTKNLLLTSVNSNMPKDFKAVMKPEVADFFISNFTQEGDLVLDCFLGIGTTGISCKKFNRKFIGIEIEEQHFNKSKKLLQL